MAIHCMEPDPARSLHSRATTTAVARPRRRASERLPPRPESQSFSRSYGSSLPTSLIYIVLSTRGCTPWRPDAVISTPGGASRTLAGIFTGPPEGSTRGKVPRSSSRLSLSPAKPIPGKQTVKQQRERCAGLRRTSPHAAWALPQYPFRRPRNINLVPFR